MAPLRRWQGLLVAALGPLLGSFVLFAAAAAPAGAQVGSEHITNYDVVLRIEASGELLVTETIAYDFGFTSRHGILRDIPVRFHYDGRYDRVYPLHVEEVSASAGTPAKFKVETSGSLKRIRIGDPDKTILGEHIYKIVYRVKQALNGFPEHDELYWNAIGSQWDVPIDEAQVTVEAPAAIRQVACSTGPDRSTLDCASKGTDGAAAHFSQHGMNPHENLTVVVSIARGAVPAPVPKLDERWSAARAFSATPATLGASGALLLLIVVGFGRLVWKAGRDRRFAGSGVDVVYGSPGADEQTVPFLERPNTPVEFEPPDKLRPGQVGTLIDERANPLDVIATVVDLGVRGYLRIEEVPKEGWFGKSDWNMVKLKDADEALKPYEKLLLNGLFKSGKEVRLSGLKNTFAERLHKVENALYDDAISQKWFAGRPDKVRVKWTAIGITVTVLAVVVCVLTAVLTHAGLVPIPLFIGGLLLMASAHSMPRRTAQGTAVLRRVNGFREFIETSEKERARFAERQNLFSEYLPYAIVFGCTEKWARAFAGIDGELPEMGWYSSSMPFTVGAFSSSMDNFATTTAGTISSTPSSSGSSGFGGGGFSGGGGGGGGGGSW